MQVFIDMSSTVFDERTQAKLLQQKYICSNAATEYFLSIGHSKTWISLF